MTRIHINLQIQRADGSTGHRSFAYNDLTEAHALRDGLLAVLAELGSTPSVDVDGDGDGDDDDDGCEGHESLAGEHMGETVYCDGSCRR